MRTPKFRLHTFRLQGAMEFMMTYGWAILIIVIVLGAFFTLGVFNSSSFSSRARAGGCYVSRPDGPYSTQMVNLAGVCNGALPEFVAYFSGQNDIAIPGSPQLDIQNTISISYWIKYVNGGEFGLARAWDEWRFFNGNPNVQTLYIYNVRGGTNTDWNTGWSYSTNVWYHITWVNSGSNEYLYVNGSLINSRAISGTLSSTGLANKIYLGAYPGGNGFTGTIANVQIYNDALTSNEIKSLYLAGIGSSPLSDSLNHLVGWWPLNGNAKDYSGNRNDGIANSISYISTWTSDYSIKS